MQAQSRLGVTGGSTSISAPEDEHEAVIRELTRGRQLTARLRAEALRALRGQGQAEATAALILQEVSRAFTVCLDIMGSPAAGAAPPPAEMPGVDAAAAAPFSPVQPRRNREDSIPREQTVTPSPHYDGYQWRKYGQKRITKTQYPRCYYRCSFHRERGCRATKQVQQCGGGGDQPQYLVMYFNDHTCHTAAWETEPAAASASASASAANPAAMIRLDMSGAGLVAPRRGGGLLDERGVQEEHERQVLVSSLACVLGAQQQFHHHQSHPPAAAAPDAAPASSGAAVAVNVARAAGPAPAVDAASGMPRLDVDVVGLDVMDYDGVPGELCFGDSYGLPGGGDGLPF